MKYLSFAYWYKDPCKVKPLRSGSLRQKNQTIAIVTQLEDKICSRANLDLLISIIWINLMCLRDAGETPRQLHCPSHGGYKWIKAVFSFSGYKTLGCAGQCLAECGSGILLFPGEGTTSEIWFLRCLNVCRAGGVRVPGLQGHPCGSWVAWRTG